MQWVSEYLSFQTSSFHTHVCVSFKTLRLKKATWMKTEVVATQCSFQISTETSDIKDDQIQVGGFNFLHWEIVPDGWKSYSGFWTSCLQFWTLKWMSSDCAILVWLPFTYCINITDPPQAIVSIEEISSERSIRLSWYVLSLFSLSGFWLGICGFILHSFVKYHGLSTHKNQTKTKSIIIKPLHK